jgi:hypothetical protein
MNCNCFVNQFEMWIIMISILLEIRFILTQVTIKGLLYVPKANLKPGEFFQQSHASIIIRNVQELIKLISGVGW